jgi:hypothetical protein
MSDDVPEAVRKHRAAMRVLSEAAFNAWHETLERSGPTEETHRLAVSYLMAVAAEMECMEATLNDDRTSENG